MSLSPAQSAAALSPARLIARHHLGEHLRDVIPVGSGYNVLIHLGDGGYRGAFASEAEDLPAVCQEAADQLRAAGWTPTHARLEWRPYQGGCELRLCIDAHSQVLFTVEEHYKPGCYNLSAAHDGDEEVLWECAAAEVFAFIAEWHAVTLPSLHLPPFPTGASDAS